MKLKKKKVRKLLNERASKKMIRYNIKSLKERGNIDIFNLLDLYMAFHQKMV